MDQNIDGAIDGVQLNLFEANPDSETSLEIVNDHDAVRDSIDTFVARYNELVFVVDQLTAYDAGTKLAGPLLGDTTARSIRDQLRREMSVAVTDLEADFSTLSEVGIEIQLDGSLEVDSDKLSGVLGDDFTRFGQLFSATDGYAVRMYDLADIYLRTGGILQTRTDGLNTQIEDFNDQRVSLNERLVSLEARLLRQFNALDSLLGELTQTSTFLNQQLSNLPGFTTNRSGNR